MVKLTEEIKESMKGIKTIYLATSSKSGEPNVIPMGAYKLLDDETMLLSDQFMKKTLKNLEENPHAAIAFWGENGGYQLKGTVTIHKDDQVFKDDVAWIKSIKPNLNPKGALVLKIAEVFVVKPGPDAGKKIL